MSAAGGAAITVAVIGCGFQGGLHVEFLSELDDVEIVAVCDRDEARAEALARRFGVGATYRSHTELLEAQSVDLVTVCTMPNSHREIVIDALGSGAHVLCEKPLALDLEDGRAMVAAGDAAGRTLGVGFNHRYMSAAQAVRRFVEEGRLGVPVCARGSMLETEIPWWGPHHVRALSGGGALAATAVHMVDLVMWLAGNPRPLTATASAATLFPRKRGAHIPAGVDVEAYSVEDLLFGHVRFDSGFWMSIEGAWVWDEPGWDCRLTLVGDRAQANLGPLALWQEREGKLRDVTGEARGDLDFHSSMRRQLATVVQRLRDGLPPLASAREALAVQSVVDALYRSAELGREVAVDPVDTAVEGSPAPAT